MQEYWKSYMKPIDEKPAIVAFNASAGDYAPDFEHMYAAFVKVKLQRPKENGLITQEEGDDISFIEDRIEFESLRYRSGKYIGRIISDGYVTFIYYLKLDFEWQNTVKDAMQHFSNYSYEFGSRTDAQWEIYKRLLFPTAKQWQIISNHHTCNKLKEQNDNLYIPRAIEHKAYFKTIEARHSFEQTIKKEGFTIQKQTTVPFNDTIIYGIIFYRTDNPFYYDIDELTLHLIDISTQFDGDYDGWECSLVKK